jgi:hypothetical protein
VSLPTAPDRVWHDTHVAAPSDRSVFLCSIGGWLSVTESWIAGREAVHAVSKFFLDQKWIFMEVPGYADFGKDGSDRKGFLRYAKVSLVR